MSTVYVVQRPGRIDLSPANAYGTLVELLGWGCQPWATEAVMEDLRVGLAAYDASEDWLLLCGNPCLIGMACAVASTRGPLRMLQWDRRVGQYRPITAHVSSPAWRRAWEDVARGGAKG